MTSPVAGGVVLVPGATGNAAERNNVMFNVILNNQPADVIDESGASNNTFRHNTCDTSQPDGLCHKSSS